MTPRRAALRERGRAEVLDRAAHAIARHGYHGMSMRDLAKATGRGLASFYTLFRSKEDILFELQSRAFAELIEDAETNVNGAKTAVGKLEAFVAAHVKFTVEQPDVMRVLIQEAAALPPARRAQVRALKERYFAIGERVVRLVAGRSVPEPELVRLTYTLFGMLNWIYGWYEPAQHGSAEEVVATICRVTQHGIVGGVTGGLVRVGQKVAVGGNDDERS